MKMQHKQSRQGLEGTTIKYMHEKLWILKWSWKAQNVQGKKKAFSGWIYFNNYNVFKEFPDMIKRLSLLICRKGKEEEQVNRRSLV